MTTETKPIDPQSVFCEVCLKRVPQSEALSDEARDHTAWFCSAACYEAWRGVRAPAAPPAHEVQEGTGRSVSRDERLKRAARQHPQRDEPRADSVEPGELPPP